MLPNDAGLELLIKVFVGIAIPKPPKPFKLPVVVSLLKPKPVVQVEISNHSNFDRMMISKILRSLQQKGFIKRKEHATDTRAKCVFLTNKGIDVLKKVIEINTNISNSFFEKLENRDGFRDELKKMIV